MLLLTDDGDVLADALKEVQGILISDPGSLEIKSSGNTDECGNDGGVVCNEKFVGTWHGLWNSDSWQLDPSSCPRPNPKPIEDIITVVAVIRGYDAQESLNLLMQELSGPYANVHIKAGCLDHSEFMSLSKNLEIIGKRLQNK